MLLAGAAHGRLVRPHPPRAERPTHQRPALLVLGIVHVGHHRERVEIGPHPVGVREDIRMASHLPDEVVAHHTPHPPVPMHRIVRSQPRQRIVMRAAPERAAHEIDLGPTADVDTIGA